ncbi:MAG: Rieske (2Fe-2S) protein [Chloroflexi bacterium]|nr:Rieske (2Fe-2S) protein [Chloroflexota bacterium]
MLTAEQNDRLSLVGARTPCGELMRRYWHPLAASSQLPRAGTRAVRLLGEDLVLYRDRQGQVGLVEPHCAHRRAGLVFGIPDERGLRCTYHGWLYDRTGQCLDQPYEAFVDPNNTFKDRIRIKAYPAEELGGLIFAYLGPEPRPLLPRWEAFVRDDLVREIGIAIMPCNWLQAVENVGDATHVVYTHGHFSRYALDQLERPDLRRLGGTTTFRPVEDAEVSTFGWGNVVFPYNDVQHDSYQIRVPVDDTHTMHFYYSWYTADDGQLSAIDVAPQSDATSIPFFLVPVPGLTNQGEPTWECGTARGLWLIGARNTWARATATYFACVSCSTNRSASSRPEGIRSTRSGIRKPIGAWYRTGDSSGPTGRQMAGWIARQPRESIRLFCRLQRLRSSERQLSWGPCTRNGMEVWIRPYRHGG